MTQNISWRQITTPCSLGLFKSLQTYFTARLMSAAFEEVGSSIWFEANGVDLGRVWLIRQFLAIYLYLALTVTDTLERSNRPTDTRRYIGRHRKTL